ncbi:MAG: hypothetical protein CMP28_11690 [Roseibacillus sp.]|nr:hypothetical protein [Roseibacillus sp.]
MASAVCPCLRTERRLLPRKDLRQRGYEGAGGLPEYHGEWADSHELDQSGGAVRPGCRLELPGDLRWQEGL